MRRILCLVLALCLLSGLSGCVDPYTTPSIAATQPTTVTAPTTTALMEKRYQLFSVTAGPTPITGEELLQINRELEEILSRKSYTPEGKTMVRDTVQLLCENYPKFQYLFSFLAPPDTAGYIRRNILFPLDTMVDTLTISDEQFGGGWAADATKEICIYVTQDQEYDCNTLIHELNHMLKSKEHWLVSSNLYQFLSEGDATLHQLSALGERKYRIMGDIRDISRDHSEPNSRTRFLRAGGFGGGNYSDYSLMFFKLLALTDFETMALFDQPDGEFLIREDLGRRYGQEGLDFYDSLTTKLDYNTLLDAERRFLKLFVSRVSEVESAEQMLSYLLLYRLYRISFAPAYLEMEGDLIRELEHPQLDYSASDWTVAKAVLQWGVLNTECLNAEEAELAAFVVAGRTVADGTDAYWERWDREFYQPIDPFLLCGAWYTVGADVTITCTTELPEGDEIFYFDRPISDGLHAMKDKGLIPE